MMAQRSWSKGFTKENHTSIRKISETMKRKKIDNFKAWRDRMRKSGKIKSEYPELIKNGDLAELIGVVLGDGHIGTFPRSECLRITGNSNNPRFISRYAMLLEKVFGKKATVARVKASKATTITIYEKHISRRLKIPAGDRKDIYAPVPRWILKEREFMIRYLRGLYEAEGSYGVHLPTYTHKFSFSNTNQALLNNVVKLLKVLGFSPHSDSLRVQISKKAEVERAVELLEFRKY